MTATTNDGVIGALGFYPHGNVDVLHIERFTAAMKGRMGLAGAWWAAIF
jgi:hypothetical protein